MTEEKVIVDLIGRARIAQEKIWHYTQQQVDQIAADIMYTFSRPELASRIAQLALEETEMGRIDSKVLKLTYKLPAIFYQIKTIKTIGIIETDHAMGITKLAKPLGIIAALIPSTNPEATPIFKGVLSLRARNAIIFAPHPKSIKTTLEVVRIMRECLKKHDAPEDLFICIEAPSKKLSQELMRQCDITMATGSADMVTSAYSSGKPAYGVGAGNAVVVIDESADLEDATDKIISGKLGDHASGCSAENTLVIQQNIYEKVKTLLQEKGGYLLSQQEKDTLQNVMWEAGALSRKVVAKPAAHIAQLANIELAQEKTFLMVEENGIGKDFPFSGEKMSLVLTLYSYEKFGDAIDKVNHITAYSGKGHSCGIHSTNQADILNLAMNTYTTKVIVRQPHGIANSGTWFNGLANTFSLGCGTWGDNIVSENITQKHYFNTTWIAEPIERTPLSDKDIFGEFIPNL